MPLLADVNSEAGALALKLFKMLFAFFSNYPDTEAVLLPHLVKMTDKALRAAVAERDALGYLQVRGGGVAVHARNGGGRNVGDCCGT